MEMKDAGPAALCVGRDDLLDRIVTYNRSSASSASSASSPWLIWLRSQAIPGGTGKTTLAQTAANDPRLKKLFPGRTIDCQLKGHWRPLSAAKPFMLKLLEFLKQPVEATIDADVLSSAYNRLFLLKGPLDSAIILLDDLEPPEMIHALLPKKGGSSVCFIVTSRKPFVPDPEGSTPDLLQLDVPPLDSEASQNCFLQLLQRAGANVDLLNEHDRKEMRKLVNACGNIPLALKIVANNIVEEQKRPNGAYFEKVCKRVQVTGLEPLAASTLISYTGLPGNLQQTLQQAAAFSVPFKQSLFQAAFGEAAAERLPLLERRAFLDLSSDDRYLLHDHIREFVQNKVPKPAFELNEAAAHKAFAQAYAEIQAAYLSKDWHKAFRKFAEIGEGVQAAFFRCNSPGVLLQLCGSCTSIGPFQRLTPAHDIEKRTDQLLAQPNSSPELTDWLLSLRFYAHIDLGDFDKAVNIAEGREGGRWLSCLGLALSGAQIAVSPSVSCNTEPYLRSEQVLRESISTFLDGRQDLEKATALGRLGRSLYFRAHADTFISDEDKIRLLAEASNLLLQTLTIRSERLGEFHPEVGTVASHLAVISERINKYLSDTQNISGGPGQIQLMHIAKSLKTPEQYHRRALSILSDVPGAAEARSDFAIKLHRYGRFLDTKKRYMEAEAIFRKALETRCGVLGIAFDPQHINPEVRRRTEPFGDDYLKVVARERVRPWRSALEGDIPGPRGSVGLDVYTKVQVGEVKLNRTTHTMHDPGSYSRIRVLTGLVPNFQRCKFVEVAAIFPDQRANEPNGHVAAFCRARGLRLIGFRSVVVAEKEKPFNYIRPRWYDVQDKEEPGLLLQVFPGEDYVRHYAYMVRMAFEGEAAGVTFRTAISSEACSSIAQFLELSNLELKIRGRLVILGDIRRLLSERVVVGEPTLVQHTFWELTSFEKVAFLGFKTSYWGNIARRIVSEIYKEAAAVLYFGKAGTLSFDRLCALSVPRSFELVHGIDETDVVEINGASNQLFRHAKPFLFVYRNNLLCGRHASVPTVLLESVEQREHLVARGVTSVDDEISYMADAAVRSGKHFACVHILTDYLYNAQELKEIDEKRRPPPLYDLAKEEAAAAARVKEASLSLATIIIRSYITEWDRLVSSL